MKINVRRGLFRLWIIMSVPWAVGTGAVFSRDIFTPTIPAQVYVMPNAKSDFFKLDNIYSQFDDDMMKAHRIVDFPNNLRLLIEKNVPDDAARARATNFFEEYSKPRDNEVKAARLKGIREFLLFGAMPPLMLLIIGWAVSWAVAGFKGDQAA
jgi:hypothetical protein